MSEWRMVSIGDLGKVVTGSTPRASEQDSWGDHLDFITPSDQETGWREATPSRRLSVVGAERLRSRVVPANSTCFTCIGSIGKVSLTARGAVTNQQVNTIVPNREHDGAFIYYLLLHRAAEIAQIASGSATPIINKAHFSSYRLPVPGLEVQQAMGRVLGALDDKRAVTERIARTCRDLADALFRQAVSASGSRSVPLSEIALHKPGKYLAKDAYVAGGPYAVYGSNSIMGRHAEYLYEGRFAVLARIGSKCGSIRWTNSPAWVNNNASAIVPRSPGDALVLRHALDTVDMAPHRSGSAQPFIRVDSLMATEVTVPATDAHGRLTGQLEALAEREDAARSESRGLAQLRDTLLPQLMSGRLRVKDVEKIVEDAT